MFSFFLGTDDTDYTDFHILMYTYRSELAEGFVKQRTGSVKSVKSVP